MTAEVEKGFRVSEIFGPTIQGEGPLIGTPCYFIRFGGCDYDCYWCDSKYSVTASLVRELPDLTTDEIMDRVLLLPGQAEWVVLTGGNPCLWNLRTLISKLHDANLKVALETQGTRMPDWIEFVDSIVVSPKGPSALLSENLQKKQLVDLMAFMQACEFSEGETVLKVVIFSEGDLDFAEVVHTSYPEIPMYLSCGTDAKDNKGTLLLRYKTLIENVLSNRPNLADCRILPQLHVLVWGHERSH